MNLTTVSVTCKQRNGSYNVHVTLCDRFGEPGTTEKQPTIDPIDLIVLISASSDNWTQPNTTGILNMCDGRKSYYISIVFYGSLIY